MKALIELGLVSGAARRSEVRGAPSTDLAINPDGGYALGLDFNREHLTGVLVDLAGTVHQRADIEVELPTPDQALDEMTEMTESLVSRQRVARERVCGTEEDVGPHFKLPRLYKQRRADDVTARRVGGKATAPALPLATAGADAVALGVATLPIHEAFAPAPQVLPTQNKRAQPTGLNADRASVVA